MDHFKKINDTYGHQMGDRLLEHVATHLKNLVNQNEHIARFGGDDFVLIYPYKQLEDDFGTGYSSLSILKKQPISMVKIDKSFIFGNDPGAS